MRWAAGVGSLAATGGDRTRLKAVLSDRYPSARDGTVAAWAGVLLLFGFEAAAGDLVIHPNRASRTVAFGSLIGGYYFDHRDLHCRRVRWMVSGVPRGEFSEAAQKAMSNRRAFFAVHDGEEFRRWLRERNIR